MNQISNSAPTIEQGALYPALYRLEGQGLLVGTWGTAEHNRRAKLYRLTAASRRRLTAETDSWKRVADAIGAALRATPEEI